MAHGPPVHISLAAYVGWKAPTASVKKDAGTTAPTAYDGDDPPPGYAPLSELMGMFEDTGGVIA